MDRVHDRVRQPAELHEPDAFSAQKLNFHHGAATAQASEFRQFAFRPIVGPNKQRFGYEALFHADWDNKFRGDRNNRSRIMLDNWLLYGFEELIDERAVFLNCT